MEIFIPGNVPSLRNSKVKCSRGIFHSTAVRRYLQGVGIAKYSKRTVTGYINRPNYFWQAVLPVRDLLVDKPLPHIVGLYFVRKTKAQFDWLNIAQIVCDLLVAHRVIEDDSIKFLIPSPYQIKGRWYHVDKDKPGCTLSF